MAKFVVPLPHGTTEGKSGKLYARKVTVSFFETVMCHDVIQL